MIKNEKKTIYDIIDDIYHTKTNSKNLRIELRNNFHGITIAASPETMRNISLKRYVKLDLHTVTSKKSNDDSYYYWVDNIEVISASLTKFFIECQKDAGQESSEKIYFVEGDITDRNFKFLKTGNTLLHITDTLYGKPELPLYVSNIPKGTNLEKTFTNKRIVLKGTLKPYKGNVQLLVNYKDIIIEGESHWLQQIKEWEVCLNNRYGNYSPSQKLNFSSQKPILVLTPKGSVGYQDFLHKLSTLSLEVISIKLTAENMKAEIERHDLPDKYCAICIVRGGGYSYELTDFNNPVFIEAVINATIPILIGVGHSTDKFLCDKYVYKSKITPTDLADYINEQIKLSSSFLKKIFHKLGF